MGREIRILLVDDHSLFRESLSRLLEAEPDLRIAGNCSNVTEALAILDREPVDLVLLDYDLGEQEGISSFFEALKSRTVNCRVLMVTAGMSDAGTLRAARRRRCEEYFLKHSPPSQLVEAIYRVMAR